MPALHIIVCRNGPVWAVSFDAERVCDHPTAEAALVAARRMVAQAAASGQPATLVNLSQDTPTFESPVH